MGGAVTILKAVAVLRNTHRARNVVGGASNAADRGDNLNGTSVATSHEGVGGGATHPTAAPRRLVSEHERPAVDAASMESRGGVASIKSYGQSLPDVGDVGGRGGGFFDSLTGGEKPVSGRDPRSGDIRFDEEEEDCSWRVPDAAEPRAVWQGHAGAVSMIGSCSQPPCFFTLGEVRPAAAPVDI